jgi:hypothetical protein
MSTTAQRSTTPGMSTASPGQQRLTKDWASIVARYAEAPTSDASINGVATLARHIRDTELSSGLFGWTSMFDLCITQTEVFYPYTGPYLRVKPQPAGMVEFRYLDTQIEKQQWQRSIPASETVTRLRSFLVQLHWFAEPR